MKKNVLVLIWIVCCVVTQSLGWNLTAQERTDLEIITQIADQIVESTTYDFIHPETNKVVNKFTRSNFDSNYRIRSSYNGWYYWNGVLNIAMLRLAENLNKPEYKDFAVKNYEFAFDNYPFFEKAYTNQRRWQYPFALIFTTKELDDCGAMGAGLIEVHNIAPRDGYVDYIEMAADHMMNKQLRLYDRTYVRHFPHQMTLWGDDLYMAVVFLARMGKFSGDNKYFDDAILQVEKFNHYLYNPSSGLYYHSWYSDLDVNGVAKWGRCNGWIMLAQVDLLEQLPEDYPGRDKLLRILLQQVVGAARYQSPSGLWHQILDKNDSYLETSVTAMFTYSIAKAVNEGWLDKRYISVAMHGWEGVKSQINEKGQVSNICIGTMIEDNIAYYYNRPAPLGDTHGLGPILMAGNEIIRYRKMNP